MKNMKSILSILVISLLVLSLFAACSSGDGGPGATDTSAADKQTAAASGEMTDGADAQNSDASESPAAPTGTGEPSEPSVTVEPGEAVVFTVGNATGKVGENVSVPVSISGNPGIAGYSYTIFYDQTKLEIVSVQNEIDGAVATCNKTEPGKVRIMATDSGVNPIGKNGLCDTVTFKILDGASGTIALNVKLADSADSVYQCFDVYSFDFPEYPSAFVDGSITVG